MRTISTLPIFAGLMLAASTAWACPMGTQDIMKLAVIAMPILTMPYWLFGTAVIAARSHGWYPKRRLRSWLVASIGAVIAATLGGIVGAALMLHAMPTSDAGFAVFLSTPLVVEVAYLSWLGSRARRRRTAQVDIAQDDISI